MMRVFHQRIGQAMMLALMAFAHVPAIGAATEPAPAKHSPEDWSEAELRAFRGSIATVRMMLPFGPRPNHADNVLFTPMYGRYSATDRARARAAYKARGYTHWPIGPLITGTYSDQYPDVNDIDHPDRFADQLDELWSDGLVPVLFLLPLDSRCGLNAKGKIDWPSIEHTLPPIYQSPRYQRLARVVVLAWEPDDGGVIDSTRQWIRAVQWMAKMFPHALRYVHFTSGRSAPCSADESQAQAWREVSPFIDGWLIQSGRFGETAGGGNDASKNAFMSDLSKSVRRLHDGADGWPTTSAVAGRPLDLIAFEYASYWSYWKNRPERESQAWGEAAINVNGIAGFCDGGPGPSNATSRPEGAP